MTQQQYEVVEDRERQGEWRVEAIDPIEGTVSTAIFIGPDAKTRALDYGEWMNRRARMASVRGGKGR